MLKTKKINFTKIKIYNKIKMIGIIFFIVPIYAIGAIIGISFETCKIIYQQIKSKF